MRHAACGLPHAATDLRVESRIANLIVYKYMPTVSNDENARSEDVLKSTFALFQQCAYTQHSEIRVFTLPSQR
jgi:hypothetical protein